jgi:hypothetical protein
MHLRFFYFFVFLFVAQIGFSQNKITLSGYISDAQNGETLIGASIYNPKLKIGAVTNEYGYYSLEIPTGKIEIIFSYIGYNSITKLFKLTENFQANIELVAGRTLQEIEISAESNKEVVNSTQMSVEKLSMREAKLLPALFGEVDIIKTLQLKPGVKSGGEGTSGIVVRGGSPDQNLFILDEAVIYNPSHLFGFFSTFNSDAVKDVQLYKGGFPAQYGGRLSSVIDVKLNEGNKKEFSGAGGVGLISSRLTLEGPLKKDKSSFMVSGRRTYVDLITRQINNSREGDEDFNPIPDYFFYDLNAKMNFEVNDKNKIYWSGYLGRDFFKFSDDQIDINFNWGNTASTLRWNRIINPRFFSNLSFTISDYNYKFKNRFGDLATFTLTSGIRDYTIKQNFFFKPNNKHNIRFGIDYTRHQFEIGRLQFGDDAGSFNFTAGQNFTGNSFAGYFADDFEINKKWKINYGVRISGFYNEKFFGGIEPRFSAKYSLNPTLSLKASYTNMSQYVHLVSTSGASLPTDIWYPTDIVATPQRSNQIAAGVSWSITDNLLLTNEVYYKWTNRVVDLRDGAQIFVNDDLSSEFVFGNGTSYGNELYLEKKKGKFTGWIGYTLALSELEFPEIRNGDPFPPRYDTRHDLSIVGLFQLNRRWNFTATWIFTSGAPTTIPIGRFFIQGIPGADPQFVIPEYSLRNDFRMPNFHRMDLGVVCKFWHKWGTSDLTLSIYNAYDRRNPFFLYIDINDTNEDSIPDSFKAKQVSLFPILPSLTYNFKF